MAKRRAPEPDYEPPLQGGSYVRTEAGELERREATETPAAPQADDQSPAKTPGGPE